MKIAVATETTPLEARCALSPAEAKKLIAMGATVTIQAGAGKGSSISDEQFRAAGVSIVGSAKEAYAGADIVLSVNMPSAEQIAAIPAGAHLIGMLSPLDKTTDFKPILNQKIHAYAMELLPRISRAQSMDILSSQSNLAGYRAVIEAVSTTSKVVPMMMTAAGTVPPAKALILGAGVAGLQAIATAKRLGAVVSAFDVRPAVKEQVMSLGAKFVEVPAEGGETAGGYAKEMSEEYKAKQAQLIHDTLKTHDIVISTALIPGRPAPELITEAMVKDMKPGSVIVDLATASGGNCKLSKRDEVIVAHGVTLIGHSNLPSRAASDATPLFARNLYNFISTLMVNKEKQFAMNWEDELIKGTLVAKDGELVHQAVKGA